MQKIIKEFTIKKGRYITKNNLINMADEKPKEREIKEAFNFEGGDLLKKILEKHPSGISGEERDILKARRSYLTEQQLKDFNITDEVDPEDEDEGDEGKTLAEMNTKELKAIAKSKKIKLKRGIKDAEIIKLIEAFDAENDDEDDDEDEDEE